MPARKVVSDRQLEILLSFMEENKGFAVGRMSNTGPLAKLESQQRWEELATTLNSVGAGATRTSVKWRDYWNEKKYGVRRKVSEHRQHGKGTGGGPAKKWSLTPQEERIFAILGKEAVSGNTSVQVPLHYTQPATSITPSPAPTPASPPASSPPSEPVPEPASSPPSEPVPEPASSPPSEPVPEPALFLDVSLSESTSASAAAAPSGVPSPMPPPQLVTTPRRSYTSHAAQIPQWAMQIEERHVEHEERTCRSLEAIAAAITTLQRSVAHIEEMLVKFVEK